MTAVVLAALLYPAVALNLRLAGDSRFDVEAWMREHFTDDPSILAVGSQLYLPNLYPYQHRIVQRASVAEILTWDADVLVINEDWLERPGQPSDETIERELGEARYRRAYATGAVGAAKPARARSWPADCTSIRCSRISPRRARPSRSGYAMPRARWPRVRAPRRVGRRPGRRPVHLSSSQRSASRRHRASLAAWSFTPAARGATSCSSWMSRPASSRL